MINVPIWAVVLIIAVAAIACFEMLQKRDFGENYKKRKGKDARR